MNLKALRRTTAEVLANALHTLFPHTILVDTITTDIGFHYDVILKNPLDTQALPLIEERMRFLAKQNSPIKILEMMRQNAAQYLSHHGQKLLAEKVSHSPDNVVSILQMDDFVDICSGELLSDTSDVRFFKLQGIQQVTPEITRIYGTAFYDNYELKQFLKRYDEAKARDHVQIGEELRLFTQLPNSDAWIWLKLGNDLRHFLTNNWIKVHADQGFELISVPLAMPENAKIENPDNCIGELDNQPYIFGGNPHQLIANLAKKNSKHHSLPLRYHLLTQRLVNYSNEQLCGLFETRMHTIDRAYIFCSREQLAKELISSLQFITKIIKIFGFEYQWHLNTHRSSRSLTKDKWNKEVDELAAALEATGISYSIDKETETREGPKIEIRIADAFGRYWSGPFVGIDLTQPIGDLVMVTRSCFGSLERFIALIIEHYAEDLPFWIVPEFLELLDNVNDRVLN